MLIDKNYVIAGFKRLADLCDQNGDSNSACLARQIAARCTDLPDKAFAYVSMEQPTNQPDPEPAVASEPVASEPVAEATPAPEQPSEPAPAPAPEPAPEPDPAPAEGGN